MAKSQQVKNRRCLGAFFGGMVIGLVASPFLLFALGEFLFRHEWSSYEAEHVIRTALSCPPAEGIRLVGVRNSARWDVDVRELPQMISVVCRDVTSDGCWVGFADGTYSIMQPFGTTDDVEINVSELRPIPSPECE